MTRTLTVAAEVWPLAGTFTIARGSRTEAQVVVATITERGIAGRGECVPYARYGETIESVIAQIESLRGAIGEGLTRIDLQSAMPAGAARNALDCAFWDVEAKKTGRRAFELAGVPHPRDVTTAFTISVGSPDAMEAAARAASARPLLKIKLAGEGDGERLAAVRRGAPNAVLIADANEAWTEALLPSLLRACQEANVALIEQPLPAATDGVLKTLSVADRHGIPLCADESLHTADDLDRVAERYQAINIKLDKTGGLTAALRLKSKAEALSLQMMIGCMVGTSLAMAPALLLTTGAHYVDLDGPLLLAKDREPGLQYRGSVISPAEAAVWG